MSENLSNSFEGLLDWIGNEVDKVEEIINYPYEQLKNFITGDYPERVPAKEAYDVMSSFMYENGVQNGNNIEFQGKQWELSFNLDTSLLTITRQSDNTVLFQGDRDTLFSYNANEKEMRTIELIDEYMQLEEEASYGTDLEID